MLASPAALFAGLAERVGQRYVCGGGLTLYFGFCCLSCFPCSCLLPRGLCPLSNTTARCAPLGGRPVGNAIPSVDMHSVYTVCLQCTVCTVQGTHTPCAPHSRGRDAPLPCRDARALLHGPHLCRHPGSGADQPCSSRAADGRLWSALDLLPVRGPCAGPARARTAPGPARGAGP